MSWRAGQDVCPHDAIAPAMLGGIEGLIGHAHNLGKVCLALAYDQADADRHAGRHLLAQNLLGSTGLPKLFRILRSPILGDPGHEGRKLLSSVPRHQDLTSLREGAQDAIATRTLSPNS